MANNPEKQSGSLARGLGNTIVAGTSFVISAFRPDSDYWNGVHERSFARAQENLKGLDVHFPYILQGDRRKLPRRPDGTRD